METNSECACPICMYAGIRPEFRSLSDFAHISCPRCGNFNMGTALLGYPFAKDVAFKLSALIRERYECTGEDVDVQVESFIETISDLPSYGVSDKQLLLLRWLDRKSKFPGDEVLVVIPLDYPVAWSTGAPEFEYHIESLRARQLVQVRGPVLNPNGLAKSLMITPSGWDFLEKHSISGVNSTQVFVAMSFSSELLLAWQDGIRPAIERANFRACRVDMEPHLDRIDSKIITEIRNSRFIVADVTGQRPGVYFEAGYGMGLGLPVFWTVRKDDLANIHFDTRQYNHVVWDSIEELSEELYYRITAIIGTGHRPV